MKREELERKPWDTNGARGKKSQRSTEGDRESTKSRETRERESELSERRNREPRERRGYGQISNGFLRVERPHLYDSSE
eukprot:606459-Amorphochlora_amoeboformis.AAC.1